MRRRKRKKSKKQKVPKINTLGMQNQNLNDKRRVEVQFNMYK